MRGNNAVHLAYALHLHGGDILLATWDNALNTAARATGPPVANDTDWSMRPARTRPHESRARPRGFEPLTFGS